MVTRDHRGSLRIYLGAAPGVGKTYAMLEEGHRLREDGVDVVIGLVEDHGRAETAALISGLEVIPRRQLKYQGVEVEEMDVDAIVRRHPDVVLIDELAHTNAPGSLRPKRWQDIEVIQGVGIDVITTLNIQHIQELADVVAGITGINVRESVPDKIVESAEEIHLVDLPADALIDRLEDGKVYPQQQAAKALEHFFTVGNLTALRELALRRTADGVNERLSDFMIDGVMALPERHDCVAVLIDTSPRWGIVLRKAWRLASALHSPLVVVALADATDKQLAKHIRLSEDLGAKFIKVGGDSFLSSENFSEIKEQLTHVHCTMLVIGTHVSLRGVWPLRGDGLREDRLVSFLTSQAPRIDLVLVALEND